MQHVKIYTTAWCPYCHRALDILKSAGVTDLSEIRVDDAPEQKKQMIEITGRRTVPQIFIGDTHVGGCDDLTALAQDGRLRSLLDRA